MKIEIITNGEVKGISIDGVPRETATSEERHLLVTKLAESQKIISEYMVAILTGGKLNQGGMVTIGSA